MTDRSAEAHRNYAGLPVVGGLLRRQRQEAERVLSGLVDTITRDSSLLDKILRRVNIDAIVARMDIGGIIARVNIDAFVTRLDLTEIVDRLDIDAILARLDLDAILARMDVDALLARVDVDALVARLDLARLPDQPAVDDDGGPHGGSEADRDGDRRRG